MAAGDLEKMDWGVGCEAALLWWMFSVAELVGILRFAQNDEAAF